LSFTARCTEESSKKSKEILVDRPGDPLGWTCYFDRSYGY
jgi:hypothetical protein